jgi:Domain of unknown function (DUF4124)
MAFKPLCFGVALMLAWVGSAGAASHPTQSKSKHRSSGSGAMTYRWVDENGVVHYGDTMPPQYSQQESSVLNSRGVEVSRRTAPKTPAELAEEERQQQEILRQKQRDSFLLMTYTSVKDIEDLRDLRLDQIKGQRLAAEQYVAGLQDRLIALQGRAMNFKPYSDKKAARRMPDELADDLVRALNEMRAQQTALAAKDSEESTMRAQFQSDIDRYKELRTPRTATR